MSIDRNGKTVLTILFGTAAGFYLLNQILAGDTFGNQWVVILVLAALTVAFGIWARQDSVQEKTAEDQARESAAKAEAAAKAAEAARQQAEARTKVDTDARKKAEEEAKAIEARKKAEEQAKAEAEAKAKAEAPPAKPKAAPAPSGEPDDLTRVEGIGPKYRDALVAAGMDTFAKVAAASVEDFQQIASEAGMRNSASMATWAEQAALAAKGDWDALAALQEKLSGGRK